MDKTKIAKFRSDYDPECVLTIVKNIDGDIILDINKRRSPDGTTGEFRIAMSGGRLECRRKRAVMAAFEKIINAFNAQENENYKSEESENKKLLGILDMGAINREIGQKIKDFRNLNCLTQQELANKMRLSRFSITAYESGEHSIPLEKLYEIADIFELTVFDFLPDLSR
jgi:DNA-binding XRE family transcriptional regulator